jgi:hypothetical protein
VLLLTAGSFVPVVGWLVGVVLLWTSTLWRLREKLLGTLVVPFGLGLALFGWPLLFGLYGGSQTCTTSGGFGTTQEPAVPPPAPAQPQAVPLESVDPPPEPPFPPVVPQEPPTLPDLQHQIDAGVTSCELTGLSGWFAIPLTLLLVAPVVVAVVLYRIARRRAARASPTTGPAVGAASSPWGPLEISAAAARDRRLPRPVRRCRRRPGPGLRLPPLDGAGQGGGRRAGAEPRRAGGDGHDLPIRPWSLPGGREAFLLLLVTGPPAAGYLAVVLSRRAAPTAPSAPHRPRSTEGSPPSAAVGPPERRDPCVDHAGVAGASAPGRSSAASPSSATPSAREHGDPSDDLL